MKRLLSISVLLVAFCACSQKSKTSSADASTDSTAMSSSAASTSMNGAAAGSPLQTCNQLVEAAKANNYEQASELMVMPQRKKAAARVGKSPQKKFAKMHQDYLTEIQNISCTEEQVAGDHAIVTATSQDEQRLIPFVQQEGSWKFDMKTYRAFYSDEKSGMKSKSM